ARIGGRMALRLAHRFASLEHLRLDLLDATRWTHRPAMVAEVPAKLPADAGHRIGEEVTVLRGVELMSNPHEGSAGDLLQIVCRDSPGAIARGDAARHAHVGDD